MEAENIEGITETELRKIIAEKDFKILQLIHIKSLLRYSFYAI